MLIHTQKLLQKEEDGPRLKRRPIDPFSLMWEFFPWSPLPLPRSDLDIPFNLSGVSLSGLVHDIHIGFRGGGGSTCIFHLKILSISISIKKYLYNIARANHGLVCDPAHKFFTNVYYYNRTVFYKHNFVLQFLTINM